MWHEWSGLWKASAGILAILAGLLSIAISVQIRRIRTSSHARRSNIKRESGVSGKLAAKSRPAYDSNAAFNKSLPKFGERNVAVEDDFEVASKGL
jgi:hypothetical protein